MSAAKGMLSPRGLGGGTPSHPIKVNKTMAIVLDRNHGCLLTQEAPVTCS